MKQPLILMILAIILVLFACKKEEESNLPVVEEAPSKPVITTPSSGAFLSNCVTIKWNAISNADEYRVQVGRDEEFSLNGSLIAEAYVDAGTEERLFNVLETGTTFARMRAINTVGQSDWSDIVTFSVDADIFLNCTTPTLAQPSLISPANESAVGSSEVEFQWGGVSGAERYHLQISILADFSEFLYNNNEVFETQQIVQGVVEGVPYYWRVKARSNTETSAWSETWSFVQ